jgi:hypothetical protein
MDMVTKRRKVSTLVTVILGAIILPPVILLPRLTYHYEKICPSEPDERAGAIYPLNEHGSIVYLTLDQHWKILAGQIYLIGSVFCFLAVGVWANRKRRDLSD